MKKKIYLLCRSTLTLNEFSFCLIELFSCHLILSTKILLFIQLRHQYRFKCFFFLLSTDELKRMCIDFCISQKLIAARLMTILIPLLAPQPKHAFSAQDGTKKKFIIVIMCSNGKWNQSNNITSGEKFQKWGKGKKRGKKWENFMREALLRTGKWLMMSPEFVDAHFQQTFHNTDYERPYFLSIDKLMRAIPLYLNGNIQEKQLLTLKLISQHNAILL